MRPTPSDWCDEHRVLAGEGLLEPGRWRTSAAPYQREILDALDVDSPYQTVVWKKSARVGGTEVVNCALSYLVDVEPDPILLVFPTKEKASEEIHDRIEPMLRAQERTARFLTGRKWDVKNRRLKLSRCSVRVGWSRSADTLAGFQARYRFFDEVDKYGLPRGEADAISLGDARGMQYGDRGKSYKTSTPTTEHGAIEKLWQACPDRRRFHVPCPSCGLLQVLAWGRFRWEGSDAWEELDREAQLALGERVAAGDVAVWYACEGCDAPIRDRHKPAMLAAGQWVSEGHAPGERPRSTSVAFHIWSAYSPWVRFREIVAEALKARGSGDPKKWQNFVNSWLGEVYQELATELAPELFEARRLPPALQGRAPRWTRAVTVGVDVQADHFWHVARAAGTTPGGVGRRRLLSWGRLETWDEVRALLNRTWLLEGPDHVEVRARVMAIDVGGGGKVRAGTRTDETLALAASDPRVWAVRGKGGDFVPDQVEPFSMAATGKGKLRGVPVRMLNVQYYKTKVAGMVRQDEPEVLWEEAPDVDRVYARQMASEHQVWRHRPNGLSYLWWQPRKASAANHVWDASVYCEAAADMLNVDTLPTEAAKAEAETRAAREAREREEREPWVDASSWRGAPPPGAW